MQRYYSTHPAGCFVPEFFLGAGEIWSHSHDTIPLKTGRVNCCIICRLEDPYKVMRQMQKCYGYDRALIIGFIKCAQIKVTDFHPSHPPPPVPLSFIDLTVVRLPFGFATQAPSSTCLWNTTCWQTDCLLVSSVPPSGPDRPAQQTSGGILTLITAASPEINPITLDEC